MRALLAALRGERPQECWLTLLARAREIHDDDIRRCYAIGAFGAPLFKAGDAILTHCNAGALATAGYGTALGVIRACHERTTAPSRCSSTRRAPGCRARA